MISIKNYLKSYFYRFRTKLDIDSDFYEEFYFRLCDLED